MHVVIVLVSGIHASAWAVTAKTLYKVSTLAAHFAAVLRYTRDNVKIQPVYADIVVMHKRSDPESVSRRGKVAIARRKDLLEEIEQRVEDAQQDDTQLAREELARMFMIRPDDFWTAETNAQPH